MPPKQSAKLLKAAAQVKAAAEVKAAKKVRIIRHNISFSQLIQTYFFLKAPAGNESKKDGDNADEKDAEKVRIIRHNITFSILYLIYSLHSFFVLGGA